MGLFGKIFGKDDQEKKDCCCEMEIVELEDNEEDSQNPRLDCDCKDNPE